MNNHNINYKNLNKIPIKFRDMVSTYIDKLNNIKGYSIDYTNEELLRGIGIFLTYINNLYPEWNDLRNLQRLDIETFLHYFHNNWGHLQQKDRVYLYIIKNFIYHIDIMMPDTGPKLGANSLIFESDVPKKYTKDRRSNVIPINIRKQFDLNIKFIEDTTIRDIAFLSRRTGIAIRDICNIKAKRCLEIIKGKYFMVLDIKLGNITDHKVPIDEDCVRVLKERINYVSTLGIDNELLFFKENEVEYLQIKTTDVTKAINKLLKQKDITYMGKPFKFTSQMFRETRAIELINAGMDIIYVQSILGYRDTYMLEKYKDANEDKVRVSWEQSNKILLERKNRITGRVLTKTFVEDGECSSVDVKQCYRELNPCLNCRCFYITPEFIDNYKSEIARLKRFIQKYKYIDNCIIYLDEHYQLLKKIEAILLKLEQKIAE